MFYLSVIIKATETSLNICAAIKYINYAQHGGHQEFKQNKNQKVKVKMRLFK